MRRPWPDLRSDEEAERFVAEADLTEYDFAQMVPMRFELRRKDKSVSLRLSDALLRALKQAAARQGIPYQRFMPSSDRARDGAQAKAGPTRRAMIDRAWVHEAIARIEADSRARRTRT